MKTAKFVIVRADAKLYGCPVGDGSSAGWVTDYDKAFGWENAMSAEADAKMLRDMGFDCMVSEVTDGNG